MRKSSNMIKIISNKSNQVDDDDNQKKISETKDDQSMTLDKTIDKNNTATVSDNVTEKKTKEQII